MTNVFVLHHVRKDDEFGDDAKLIGVYSGQNEAEAACERLARRPGFVDHPQGFQINDYTLDLDHWSEGFIST